MGKRPRAMVLVVLGSGVAAPFACSDGSVATDGGLDASPEATSDGPVVLPDAGADASSDADAAPRPEPSIQIYASGDTSCALSGTKLECWGANVDSIFGPDAGQGYNQPVTVVSGVSPASAALMIDHICALSGTDVYCWGRNFEHQLGPLATACATTDCMPTKINVSGTSQLTGNYYYTCALDNNQSIACWGVTDFGVLGSNAPDAASTATPVAVSVLSGVAEIGGGYYHVCARKAQDGSVWCWGSNARGYLGTSTSGGPNGTDTMAHPTPVQVTLPKPAVRLAVGPYVGCALHADGTVSCWGSNGFSPGTAQNGHDPLTSPPCAEGICDINAALVAGLTNVRELALGGWHSCAVLQDDTVECFGENIRGALGHDPHLDNEAGAQSAVLQPKPVTGLTNVAHVAAGNAHACAVTWDSKVYCWGNNNEGELGFPNDGGALGSFTPLQVQGL